MNPEFTTPLSILDQTDSYTSIRPTGGLDKAPVRDLIEAIYFYGDLHDSDMVCCIQSQSDVDQDFEGLFGHLAKAIGQEKSKQLEPASPGPSISSGRTNMNGVWDKILMLDCTRMVAGMQALFGKMWTNLNQTTGCLVILERINSWPNCWMNQLAPQFESGDREHLTRLFQSLLNVGFDIEWDIIEVPVVLSCDQWMNNIRQDQDSQNSSDRNPLLYEYGANLTRNALKYTSTEQNGVMRFVEQILIITARPRYPPGSSQMGVKRTATSFLNRVGKRVPGPRQDTRCKLKITPELALVFDEQLPVLVGKAITHLNKQPPNKSKEWWGTVNSNTWVNMDSSKIPRKRLNFF